MKKIYKFEIANQNHIRNQIIEVIYDIDPGKFIKDMDAAIIKYNADFVPDQYNPDTHFAISPGCETVGFYTIIETKNRAELNDTLKKLDREKKRAARVREFLNKFESVAAEYNAGEITPDSCEIIKAMIKGGICTNHNGKMEGNNSISTCSKCNINCILRRNNPDLICAGCFADDMHNKYIDLRTKTELNSILYSEIDIPAAGIPFINTCIFRLESFGDLINEQHLINYFKICDCNRRTTFTLWTKNIFIVDRVLKAGYKKPDNLILIYSSPFMNKPAKSILDKYAYVDKIFTVYTLDYLLLNDIDPDRFINCGGRKCVDCQQCYNLKNKTVFINELLKSDQPKWEKMKSGK